MSCAELDRLRESARALRAQLQRRKQVALERRGEPRTGREAAKNDFEWFLQRRIAKATEAIERHIHQHGCVQ